MARHLQYFHIEIRIYKCFEEDEPTSKVASEDERTRSILKPKPVVQVSQS